MAGNLSNFFADLHEGVRRGVRAGLLTDTSADSGWPTGQDELTTFPGANATLPAWPGASGPSPFPGAGGSSGLGGGGGQPFDLLGNLDQSHYAAQAEAQAAQQRAQQGTPGARGVSGQDVPSGKDNTNLTGQRVEDWIRQTRAGSPLLDIPGIGDYILFQANAKDVSVPELMGILLKESELGVTAGPGFNLAGLGGEGNFTQYGSWQQAIDGAIDNLASDLYRGKSLQDHIGYWFVGTGYMSMGGLAATDSTGGRNGTVGDYINGPVAAAYRGLGVSYGSGGGAGGGAVPPSEIAARGQQFLGVRYTNGGIRVTGKPEDGFDCSSLAGYVIGADPGDWNAQRLADVSAPVQPNELQPGDLVFFDIANPGDATARPVGHVAVWLGNGMILQSTTLNGTNGVQITSLSQDSYLSAHVYGYGRYRGRASSGEGNR